MGEDRDSVEASARWRAEAASAAQAVIAGEVGLIEGARRLTAIGHRLVRDLWTDPDFSVLGVVDSEADDLPVGQVRAHWDPAALALTDRELAQFESTVRDAVLAACRSIRERYAAG
jgi:hypothetical protein